MRFTKAPMWALCASARIEARNSSVLAHLVSH